MLTRNVGFLGDSCLGNAVLQPLIYQVLHGNKERRPVLGYAVNWVLVPFSRMLNLTCQDAIFFGPASSSLDYQLRQLVDGFWTFSS